MVGHGVLEGGLYFAPFNDERDAKYKVQISNDDNNDAQDEKDKGWMSVDASQTVAIVCLPKHLVCNIL